MSDHYVPRLADELIDDLLAEFPALLLVGRYRTVDRIIAAPIATLWS